MPSSPFPRHHQLDKDEKPTLFTRYSDSEDLLGKWFKLHPERRQDIFLATKFGNLVDGNGKRIVRSDPAYIKEACAKSLKRLGVDTIDLYYAHRLDGVTPVEHTVQAMKELKDEGKVKFLGLSECSAKSLDRACKISHIAAVQIEYSPFTIDIERPEIDLLATCRKLGVATVAYSPLGRGMLTGAYKSLDDFEADDFRRLAPRFSKDNFPKNLELADKLEAMAKKKGVTPGQLSLAWLMRQGEDVIPIPGTKKIKYLEENVGALGVKLTDQEGEEIRRAVEEAEVVGDRYPQGMAAQLFADTPEL